MFVLDTDCLTLIQRESGVEFRRLADRIEPIQNQVFSTVVSVEEQFRGWLSYAARAKTPEQYINASERFLFLLEFFQDRSLLRFDDRAATEFTRLKAAKIRISTMDLRIAAIALANDATLITRNLSDFRKVPHLRVEDWAAG